MPFWNRYEKREVILKDGAVWKTKPAGDQWFIVGDKTNPPYYKIFTENNKMYMWVTTNDYRTSHSNPGA